jgi:hypothetical protein
MNELRMTLTDYLKPEASDRRVFRRYPMNVIFEAVDQRSKTRIQGRTSDLSRGGCFVDSISTFPVGSVLSVRLTKENRTLEVEAKVVSSRGGMGMGLKFQNANVENLATIGQWIGKGVARRTPAPSLPREQNGVQPTADRIQMSSSF